VTALPPGATRDEVPPIGGAGVSLGFRANERGRTIDGAAMQRALWDRIAKGLRERARSRAARALVADDVAVEAANGFRDGSSSARGGAMRFAFGDAAGFGVHASQVAAHFVELVILDRFDDLAAIADEFGAAPEPPRRVRAGRSSAPARSPAGDLGGAGPERRVRFGFGPRRHRRIGARRQRPAVDGLRIHGEGRIDRARTRDRARRNARSRDSVISSSRGEGACAGHSPIRTRSGDPKRRTPPTLLP